MTIGLVNDLPLALEALRRVVAREPAHRVIWCARNGAEAVAQCAQQRPDLILMDLFMPVMDGVEATRRIMAETPCAIVVVTASVGAHSSRVFEAMGHGALDAVDTPVLGAPDRDGGMALLRKIAAIGRLIGDRVSATSAGNTGAGFFAAQDREVLVAIGASAGGPAAVAAVLRALPKDFPAAVVVVQHVDTQFAAGMAEWLNRESPLLVRVASEGDRLESGVALLAATNDHLELKDPQRVGYTPDPRENVYRPSVDVFFDSVAAKWHGRVIGVLLTGMGRDGALGLKRLRNHGHVTIAQDQATSAVYGMPKAAAQLDAAAEILPLPEIAPRLLRLVVSTR